MAIREITQGVSYVVRRTDSPLYLGKLGRWYSDIRLASVYSGPREATMAGRRTDFGDTAGVWAVAIELMELVGPVASTADDDEDEEVDIKPAPKPQPDKPKEQPKEAPKPKVA